MWFCFFFFKQKTAYEMRISDWSSDVCSSDLVAGEGPKAIGLINQIGMVGIGVPRRKQRLKLERADAQRLVLGDAHVSTRKAVHGGIGDLGAGQAAQIADRKSTRLNSSH